MANLTRALVIEPTFAEAEMLHNSIDGTDSRPAQLIRNMIFKVLKDTEAGNDDIAPISITVTIREAG